MCVCLQLLVSVEISTHISLLTLLRCVCVCMHILDSKIMFRVWICSCLVFAVALAQDTLFRDQVPSRPPSQRPVVLNPLDYDVYFDPSYYGPETGGPLIITVDSEPTYVPKPFEKRPPKKVKQLQPNGPLLYSTPNEKYFNQHKEHQDLRNVPGYPGQDYPVFTEVPPTKFSCGDVPIRPGLYADTETGCQAYHVCGEDGRHGYSGASFLCTNGTVFNQYLLTCDWWYNVDCSEARSHYEVNLDPYKNPLLYAPEKEKPHPAGHPERDYRNDEYSPSPSPYKAPNDF